MSELDSDLEDRYKAQAELSFGLALSAAAFAAAFYQEWLYLIPIVVAGAAGQILRSLKSGIARVAAWLGCALLGVLGRFLVDLFGFQILVLPVGFFALSTTFLTHQDTMARLGWLDREL